MSPVGVTVTTSETPQSGGIPTTTGTAFFVGTADAGSGTTPVKCGSISDFVAGFSTAYTPRTSTNATLYDAVDVFFREGGQQAYVLRGLAGTETAASLGLSSAVPNPTVAITAKTPGVAGNLYNVVVTTATNTTFTANTATSTTLSAISSFANIGVGTLVTGAGIPANTYITAVNAGASTATLSNATTATATGVTVTPSTFTILIQDPNANVLETHGPFINTAALYADLTSTIVNFAQSSLGGNTTASPAALTATPLAGGANATVTDAQMVSTLANFPASLGAGTVSIPLRTTQAIWNGLLLHAQTFNRFAAMDIPDNSVAATLVSSIGTTGSATNASYGMFTSSSVIVPSLTASTTRVVAGSAVVAALRAQVAATLNDNQAPAGRNWPLVYVTGFTNTFNDADTNTLFNAGINPWANRFGILCLFGFNTPVSSTVDPIFFQATASVERMALVSQARSVAEPFLFQTLDGQQKTMTKFQAVLANVIVQHWKQGALFGLNATDAGSVNVGNPINTPATIAAGQLNAQLQVRISPYAQTVTLSIQFVPVTQLVTQTG